LVTVTVGNGASVLVKVQAMLDVADIAVALNVTDPAARFGVKVPPAPSPVQLIAVTAKPVAGVSVMVVATPAAVRPTLGAATAVPATVVVIVCAV
jgi:hypothetical protein